MAEQTPLLPPQSTFDWKGWSPGRPSPGSPPPGPQRLPASPGSQAPSSPPVFLSEEEEELMRKHGPAKPMPNQGLGRAFLDRVEALGGTVLSREDEIELMRELPLQEQLWRRFSGSDLPSDRDNFAIDRVGMSLAGSIAGGSIGLKTPIAPGAWGLFVNPVTGAILGSSLFAALGFASPEGVLWAGEKLGVFPEGTRDKKGLTNQELLLLAKNEFLVNLVMDSTLQAAGLVYRGAARFGTGIRRGSEAEQLADFAASQGMKNIPAVMLNPRDYGFAKLFMATMGRFPAVAITGRRRAREASMGLEKFLDKLPASWAEVFSATELGRQIAKDAQSLIERHVAGHREVKKKIMGLADDLGVRVNPKYLEAETREILDDLVKRQATLGSRSPKLTPLRQALIDTINDQIAPLFTRVASSTVQGTRRTKQTLQEMEELASRLDEARAMLADKFPKAKKAVDGYFVRLRNAVLADMHENLDGAQSALVGQALAKLNAKDSLFMNTLMNTPTAQRFFKVNRKGIRGMEDPRATQTPIDNLGEILIDLKSPQVVDEIALLVQKNPGTMQRVAAYTVNRMFALGYDQATQKFDPRKIMQTFRTGPAKGLTDTGQMVQKLLDQTSGLKMKEVEKVLDLAHKYSIAPIPDFATFLARASIIGGMRGAVSSIVPKLGAHVTGAVLWLTGMRGIATLLTDPIAGRSLKTVLDETAERSQRISAAIKVVRWAGNDPIAQYLHKGEKFNALGRLEAFGNDFNRRMGTEVLINELGKLGRADLSTRMPNPPRPNVPNLQPPGIGSSPPVLPNYIPNDPRPQSMNPASPQTMGTMNKLRDMLSPRR